MGAVMRYQRKRFASVVRTKILATRVASVERQAFIIFDDTATTASSDLNPNQPLQRPH